MKRTLKKEMVRRVGTALGPLLYELGAVKSVMPPKDFDLLIEGVLHAIRRVPAITQNNGPIDECLHVETERGDVISDEMPRTSTLEDTL
jgi:hypothetical protein